MLSFYLGLLLTPSLSRAYSFVFDEAPRQCQNVSVSITNGSGQPPYNLLIIPVGPSPLPNNVEARKITQLNFTGSATSLSTQLMFPADSQFVAVMSDSSGFGTGGTSGAVTVLDGDTSSCFDSSHSVSPPFAYSIVPAGKLTQCTPTRIWWDPAVVQGTPSFQGVIPGGQSFSVPQGRLTTVPEQGLGFSWSPSVRGGTTVILIGGDDRGPGTAGSAVFIVNSGPNDCLSDQSPSSTPGSPAGGSYPTSTSGAGTGDSGGGSHTNVGAIVGGVIGGVLGLIAIILILLFLRRRDKFHRSQKERPVDLLRDDEHEERQPSNSELPRYYEPEPFMVPDPTVTSTAGDGADPDASVAGFLRPSTDRRYSRYSGTTSESGPGLTLRSSTPDQSSSSGYMRKSPAPPTFRPVNIVQHEDAGPSEAAEPETIELPPAYTNIRSAAPPVAGASEAATDAGGSAAPRTETAQA